MGAAMEKDEKSATLIQAVAFLFIFCIANIVFHAWLHPLAARLCARSGTRVEEAKPAAPETA